MKNNSQEYYKFLGKLYDILLNISSFVYNKNIYVDFVWKMLYY